MVSKDMYKMIVSFSYPLLLWWYTYIQMPQLRLIPRNANVFQYRFVFDAHRWCWRVAIPIRSRLKGINIRMRSDVCSSVVLVQSAFVPYFAALRNTENASLNYIYYKWNAFYIVWLWRSRCHTVYQKLSKGMTVLFNMDLSTPFWKRCDVYCI